jgi:uncharacterized protein YoxC
MSVEPGLERAMYGDGARVATTTRDQYIITALNNLDKHVAELQETVEALLSRVELITQPEEPLPELGPVPHGDVEKAAQPASQVTLRIREASVALQRIGRRVRDVTDRLDT